jgi:hypothetical protein
VAVTVCSVGCKLPTQESCHSVGEDKKDRPCSTFTYIQCMTHIFICRFVNSQLVVPCLCFPSYVSSDAQNTRTNWMKLGMVDLHEMSLVLLRFTWVNFKNSYIQGHIKTVTYILWAHRQILMAYWFHIQALTCVIFIYLNLIVSNTLNARACLVTHRVKVFVTRGLMRIFGNKIEWHEAEEKCMMSFCINIPCISFHWD